MKSNKKPDSYKVTPEYVEFLEDSHITLVRTIHRLYDMVRKGRRIPRDDENAAGCGGATIHELVASLQSCGAYSPSSSPYSTMNDTDTDAEAVDEGSEAALIPSMGPKWNSFQSPSTIYEQAKFDRCPQVSQEPSPPWDLMSGWIPFTDCCNVESEKQLPLGMSTSSSEDVIVPEADLAPRTLLIADAEQFEMFPIGQTPQYQSNKQVESGCSSWDLDLSSIGVGPEINWFNR
ncbi:hypothetical protein JX265_003565 [Neoarthrinium moseri]|uniref:Uncharacterized protein n=1 Tax=Neoarthrinium moseri TaxID=1658444 RepID=A0A9P9WS26_9PEZI|nr:hypothetical protein JX265_003565 [Neoarthrinium moseri]